MSNFEYKPTRIQYANFIELKKILNELGAEGWDLVNFRFIEEVRNKHDIDCFFKREI